MTEFSAFDAPTGQVPAHPDDVPPVPPAPSPPTLPPPPEQPGVPGSSPRAPADSAPPDAPPPSHKHPKRPLPIRLLVWAVVILALVAAASLAKKYWDSSRESASAPDSDQIDVTVDSTTQLRTTQLPTTQLPTTQLPTTQPPTGGGESSGAAAPVCVELQQVQALSNEVSVIMSTMAQEISASSGAVDETAILSRFREAADLMELSLPDLLASYESAAQVAPADVAADLRIVANGTAVLTPTVVDVMRNAQAVEDLSELERALQTPEVADAAIEAGTASLRLDEFTISSCGFKFSN